jgi:hypothetical protein
MAPMAATDSPAAPTRTNEELNLSVLRRYNPAITSTLSLAPYAVVYLFNSSTQLWEKEKVGIEGTLFVCQLTQGELGEERYSVFVLNRRGTENFEARLCDGDDVKLTDEYVILRVDGRPGGNSIINDANGTTNANRERELIYGLWIFSEPAPSSTAETRALNSQLIKECAVHGGQSRKLAEERHAQAENARQYENQGAAASQGGVAMGRQVSLQELFGQQRAQDDEWSVKAHVSTPEPSAPVPQGWPTTAAAGDNPNPSGGDVLGNLFRKAGLAYQAPR